MFVGGGREGIQTKNMLHPSFGDPRKTEHMAGV